MKLLVSLDTETFMDQPEYIFDDFEVDEDGFWNLQNDWAVAAEILAKVNNIGILSTHDLFAGIVDTETHQLLAASWISIDTQNWTLDFDIVVDKAHRCKGLAGMLLSDIVDYASTNEFVLEVTVVSDIMQKMLEKRGYMVKAVLTNRVIMG